MLSSSWPLFDLQIHTPDLTLRLPSDEELGLLARRAEGNVLDEHTQHYMTGWTRLRSPEFERSFVQHHWLMRASWSPAKWNWLAGIYPSGEEQPVGIMGLSAQDFLAKRVVSTGSWLLCEWQGRGLGKQARGMILAFAFDHLGATEARTFASPDNAASPEPARKPLDLILPGGESMGRNGRSVA